MDVLTVLVEPLSVLWGQLQPAVGLSLSATFFFLFFFPQQLPEIACVPAASRAKRWYVLVHIKYVGESAF